MVKKPSKDVPALFMLVLVSLNNPKFSRSISKRVRNPFEVDSMYSLALRDCTSFAR